MTEQAQATGGVKNPRAVRIATHLRDKLEDRDIAVASDDQGNLRFEMSPTTADRLVQILCDYETSSRWDYV